MTFRRDTAAGLTALVLALAGCSEEGGTGMSARDEGRKPALVQLLGDADRAMAAGQLADAGRKLDEARRLDPNDPALWVAIARLRFRGGEHLTAIEAADRALELGPDYPPALLMRAMMVRDPAAMLRGRFHDRAPAGEIGGFHLRAVLETRGEAEIEVDARPIDMAAVRRRVDHAGDLIEPACQCVCIRNAAKRCVENEVAAVGHEEALVRSGPQFHGAAQTEFRREPLDRDVASGAAMPHVRGDLELRDVWFGAGPTPELLHRMLNGMAWLVRWRPAPKRRP